MRKEYVSGTQANKSKGCLWHKNHKFRNRLSLSEISSEWLNLLMDCFIRNPPFVLLSGWKSKLFTIILQKKCVGTVGWSPFIFAFVESWGTSFHHVLFRMMRWIISWLFPLVIEQ